MQKHPMKHKVATAKSHFTIRAHQTNTINIWNSLR